MAALRALYGGDWCDWHQMSQEITTARNNHSVTSHHADRPFSSPGPHHNILADPQVIDLSAKKEPRRLAAAKKGSYGGGVFPGLPVFFRARNQSFPRRHYEAKHAFLYDG